MSLASYLKKRAEAIAEPTPITDLAHSLDTAALVPKAKRFNATLNTIGTDFIPYAGKPINIAAALYALRGKTPALKSVDSALRRTSFMPGHGAYHEGRLARLVADQYERETGKDSKVAHELLGDLASGMASGGLGAIAGAYLGDKLKGQLSNKEGLLGTVLPMLTTGGGFAAGMMIPKAIANAAAMYTARRAKADQFKAEEKVPEWMLYALPGYAKYQYLKRLGYGYNDMLGVDASLASLPIRD